MKNRVVKLNQKQLYTLIREAMDDVVQSSSPSYDKLVEDLGQALGDVFRSQYNDADPIQSAYGREEWNVQVDLAVDEIISALLEKIEEVDMQLHSGEFAQG